MIRFRFNTKDEQNACLEFLIEAPEDLRMNRTTTRFTFWLPSRLVGMAAKALLSNPIIC